MASDGRFSGSERHSSADRADIDAGLIESASLAGTIFEDANGNGRRDPGEDAAPCGNVQLQAAGPDGVIGTTDDPAPLAQQPADDGTFHFTGLIAGAYRLSSGCTSPVDVAVLAGALLRDVDLAVSAVVSPAIVEPAAVEPARRDWALPISGSNPIVLVA